MYDLKIGYWYVLWNNHSVLEALYLPGSSNTAPSLLLVSILFLPPSRTTPFQSLWQCHRPFWHDPSAKGLLLPAHLSRLGHSISKWPDTASWVPAAFLCCQLLAWSCPDFASKLQIWIFWRLLSTATWKASRHLQLNVSKLTSGGPFGLAPFPLSLYQTVTTLFTQWLRIKTSESHVVLPFSPGPHQIQPQILSAS